MQLLGAYETAGRLYQHDQESRHNLEGAGQQTSQVSCNHANHIPQAEEHGNWSGGKGRESINFSVIDSSSSAAALEETKQHHPAGILSIGAAVLFVTAFELLGGFSFSIDTSPGRSNISSLYVVAPATTHNLQKLSTYENSPALLTARSDDGHYTGTVLDVPGEVILGHRRLIWPGHKRNEFLSERLKQRHFISFKQVRYVKTLSGQRFR